jgi:uncharacterized cupin superfamily protein
VGCYVASGSRATLSGTWEGFWEPWHYEYGEEEWVLALGGRPSVRTPQGTEELEPFDVVFFRRVPPAHTRSATTATAAPAS